MHMAAKDSDWRFEKPVVGRAGTQLPLVPVTALLSKSCHYLVSKVQLDQ